MTTARDLTAALGGRWHGCSGSACCPAHEDRSPSLSITDGRDGRLLLHCFAGCSFAAIAKALPGHCLPDGIGSATRDAAEEAKRQADMRAAIERRAQQARDLWDRARPVHGTLAEAYLRGRGIDRPPPTALRFHPAAWHAGTAHYLPAMVAAVTGGPAFAVHRTYLRAEGGGKADVEPAKAMLGPVLGGAVRLSTMPHAPLLVSEGIETALSAAILYGRLATVWAALSAPGLAGLELPEAPGELIVATDGDPPGREAGDRLAHRAYLLGWTVSLLPAPDGTDWNDHLRKGIDA